MNFKKELRENIRNGAIWLDGIFPGPDASPPTIDWPDEMDPGALVMGAGVWSGGCGCVGVQLDRAEGGEGSFFDFFMYHLNDSADPDIAGHLGLDVIEEGSAADYEARLAVWTSGSPEKWWREEIEERLA